MPRKKKKTQTDLLPEEVATQYDLIGWKGGPKKDCGRFGIIDLRTLSLQRADLLFNMGFPLLTKKALESTTKKTD